MTLQFSPQNNPRVIVIQKLYGKYYNKDEDLTFPKHRFKKFIKDVVNGTIERNDVINDEISNHLDTDLDLKKNNKVFQIIVKSAIFELLYKPKISSKIIINEYLKASNFFIEDGQTKYLNALLDKISKKLRNSNG
jgi:N utilization substance protein B